MTPEDGPSSTLEQFERALLELANATYDFTLFVNGASARSARAIGDLQAICDQHLRNRYTFQVVDVFRDLEQVSRSGILAAPTLVKNHPLPQRVLVGDLSDTIRVLHALDIPTDNGGASRDD